MAHKPAHDHGPNKPVGGGIFAVAQAKVRSPAIALLIVGVLYMIGAIGGAIYVSNPAAFTAPVENNENLTPEERQTEANLVSNVREIFEQNSPLVLIADVILSIIILIGGYKMLKTHEHRLGTGRGDGGDDSLSQSGLRARHSDRHLGFDCLAQRRREGRVPPRPRHRPTPH